MKHWGRKKRESYQPCTVPFRGDIIEWAELILEAAWEVRQEKLKPVQKPKSN